MSALKPHVTILMATRNGAAYLEAQLQSFVQQTHENWSLIASDDQSTDETRAILSQFAAQNPMRDIKIVTGPTKGASANFLSLLHGLPDDAGYVAFSDQDDVWMPQKLERALTFLQNLPDDKPALYGSRSVIVRADLSVKHPSPAFRKQPDFRNALVQNIISGFSQVLNPQATRALRQVPQSVTVAYHDWWIYQVISGIGGRVIFDQTPSVWYRQHEANVIGANSSQIARILRIGQLLAGRFQRWNDQNIAALDQINSLLTGENAKILHEFKQLRQRGGFSAVRRLYQLGLFRQTIFGNISLFIAAFLHKL